VNYHVHLAVVIKELFESKYSLKEPALLFKKKSCEYSLHIMQGFRTLQHVMNMITTVICGN